MAIRVHCDIMFYGVVVAVYTLIRNLCRGGEREKLQIRMNMFTRSSLDNIWTAASDLCLAFNKNKTSSPTLTVSRTASGSDISTYLQFHLLTTSASLHHHSATV